MTSALVLPGKHTCIGKIGNIGNICNIGNIGNICNIGNIGNIGNIDTRANPKRLITRAILPRNKDKMTQQSMSQQVMKSVSY